MSRYTASVKFGGEVCEAAWGFDHLCGYFVQVFNPDPECEDKDALLVDECSLFTGLTNGPMLERIEELGLPVTEDHRWLIACDCPF